MFQILLELLSRMLFSGAVKLEKHALLKQISKETKGFHEESKAFLKEIKYNINKYTPQQGVNMLRQGMIKGIFDKYPELKKAHKEITNHYRSALKYINLNHHVDNVSDKIHEKIKDVLYRKEVITPAMVGGHGGSSWVASDIYFVANVPVDPQNINEYTGVAGAMYWHTKKSSKVYITPLAGLKSFIMICTKWNQPHHGVGSWMWMHRISHGFIDKDYKRKDKAKKLIAARAAKLKTQKRI